MIENYADDSYTKLIYQHVINAEYNILLTLFHELLLLIIEETAHLQ